MKSENILQRMGIEKDGYPADAVFGDQIIGTYSKDRQTVCIMLADNLTQEEQDNDLEKCILHFELVKEIAYTVKTLITDFGLAVHSYTFKNNIPFKNMKVIKP